MHVYSYVGNLSEVGLVGVIRTPSWAINYLTKTSLPGKLFIRWVKETTLAIVIILGWLPELGVKTLLMKTPQFRHKTQKIELDLRWQNPSWGLALNIWRCSVSCQQRNAIKSYPAVKYRNHTNNQHGKIHKRMQ